MSPWSLPQDDFTQTCCFNLSHEGEKKTPHVLMHSNGSHSFLQMKPLNWAVTAGLAREMGQHYTGPALHRTSITEDQHHTKPASHRTSITPSQWAPCFIKKLPWLISVSTHSPPGADRFQRLHTNVCLGQTKTKLPNGDPADGYKHQADKSSYQTRAKAASYSQDGRNWRLHNAPCVSSS